MHSGTPHEPHDHAVRQTKIIATHRPGIEQRRGHSRALIAAGVDVFRLNFSHGTHDSHGAAIARIRARRSRGRAAPVAILQDLSGPKIRTGRLRRRPAAAAERRRRARRSPSATSPASPAASRRRTRICRRPCSPATRCCSTTAGSSCGSRTTDGRAADDGRRRRRARRAQGHQRARASSCRSPGLTDEGHRGSAVRRQPRASTSSR